MARYKERSQDNIMVPINLAEQLLPGTFEFALNQIVDHRLDLSCFDEFYSNDHVGPKAYSPQSMVKIVLYAYSKGILFSRKIEAACRNNIIFMALSGEAKPDHTTIASFISSKSRHIKNVFVQILMICAQLDLIGVEEFALDGCKLSSNAAKEHSGTFAEYRKKMTTLEKKVEVLLQQHALNDQAQARDRIHKAIEDIEKQKKRIEEFIETHEPRMNHPGREVKSNLTDNDSAKLKTSGGFIQGYNALVLSDSRHQIILNAYPIGRQFEGDELQPFLQDSLQTAKKAGILKARFRSATLLADTNYFSEANCRYLLQKQKMKALIPDTQFRRRDARVPAQKPNYTNKPRKFRQQDFLYDPLHDCYRCPNGKTLTRYTKSNSGPHRGVIYRTRVEDCTGCPFVDCCLKKSASRRTLFIVTKARPTPFSQRMIEMIDSPAGRHAYAQRMGIVEPVFGNIKNNKRMNRFTLRGLSKVSIQWLYYCLVHNIEKIVTTDAINRLIPT
ncbi:MAG: IS1182 family transposase [Acidobacteriota bacterium]